MLSQSVTLPPLPPEPLAKIEGFIEENRRLGYTTVEEFIRDSVRWRLNFLKEDFEFIEIPRQKYERLEEAIKDMDTPYYRWVSDFIHGQIDEALEQYENGWKKKSKMIRRKNHKETVLALGL